MLNFDKNIHMRRGATIHGNVLLFPACDSRGWVLDGLVRDTNEYEGFDPENLFFAWLLELPVGMDSADAAKTLIACSGLAAADCPVGSFKYRMRILLQGLIEQARTGVSPKSKDAAKTLADTLDELPRD